MQYDKNKVCEPECENVISTVFHYSFSFITYCAIYIKRMKTEWCVEYVEIVLLLFSFFFLTEWQIFKFTYFLTLTYHILLDTNMCMAFIYIAFHANFLIIQIYLVFFTLFYIHSSLFIFLLLITKVVFFL